MTSNDKVILRDLARRYLEVCNRDVQKERRTLWRQHNSFIRTQIPIYVRAFAWKEMPEAILKCENPFFRSHENFLRQMIFQDTIGDDYIFEPWITQEVSYVSGAEGIWGTKIGRTPSSEERGSWKYDPPIKDLKDIDKMVMPHHIIDEKKTARNVARLEETIGNILTVNVDRAPLYKIWNADISTQLANLRGLEQIMWDMTDNPEWLHRLLSFMRDGILRTHQEAEDAGDWCLCNHYNQAMPYAEESPDPEANSKPVTRDKLWIFMAAQEFTLISPQMHEEFMFNYQLPIMEKFGLVSYGCCENLTKKIDMLRRIPNLRRIAVTPWADLQRCVEQIQQDYIISWRPNPADMVSCGFNPDHVRKVVKNAIEIAKGCYIDITLKDVQTVENDPNRVREWVRIVRDVCSSVVKNPTKK
ncbi:hypothetical protein KKC91_08485 [bacterium]|nr:hypothetical protein [bacterium]